MSQPKEGSNRFMSITPLPPPGDDMHLEGLVIRPPSEADSILLQVTVGCSHNKCTFCGVYKDKRFRIKDDLTIAKDLAFAKAYCTRQRRVFLCDGDALILPMSRLTELLTIIRQELPWVTRVSCYANAKSLKMKSLDDLQILKSLGLSMLYMGLESGDDETLSRVGKYGDSALMIEQAHKAKAAGMKLSVTVLLGLAGKTRSLIHARRTGEVLSAMDPEHVGALTLMIIPGTKLAEDVDNGVFSLLSPTDLLEELRGMIEHTHLSRGQFFSNHASNYLPLKIRLPKGKDEALHLIDEALAGRVPLKPEYLRDL